MATIKVSGELKNRDRLSTTVDKGLYKAIKGYCDRSLVPMSKIIDEAVEDFLIKKGIPYEWVAPYRIPEEDEKTDR